ncbi:hypothetical protein [Sanguibacter sp. HDW7]|nr:hypothetical protein [Sanguibacter sp. HDW7]
MSAGALVGVGAVVAALLVPGAAPASSRADPALLQRRRARPRC